MNAQCCWCDVCWIQSHPTLVDFDHRTGQGLGSAESGGVAVVSSKGGLLMLLSDLANSDWLRLIRAEYLELPGMSLTKAQVQRLWGLNGTTCEALLDHLVKSGFLKQTRSREYVRAGNGY
jgi:hypothetical protein